MTRGGGASGEAAPGSAARDEASSGAAFYDAAYRRAGEREARWRELGAIGKADHVAALLGGAVGRLVEIGCGDGALLAELRRRGVAESLAGFDVSAQAVAAARARGLDSVEAFDGERVPAGDGTFDVAVLSHVLEHVEEPVALLREAARVAPRAIVEVPLEASLSGRRASKREAAQAIGHLQVLHRAAVHDLVATAGLRVVEELTDPLPAAVHLFNAHTSAARLRARTKAGIRRTVFALSPALAERLFTVHYACACTRS